MRHLPRPLMLQLSCSTTVAVLQVGLLVLTRYFVILILCRVHALTCKVRGMLLVAGFTNPTVCWLCLVMLAGLSSIHRSSDLHCCCCVSERGLHMMRIELACLHHRSNAAAISQVLCAGNATDTALEYYLAAARALGGGEDDLVKLLRDLLSQSNAFGFLLGGGLSDGAAPLTDTARGLVTTGPALQTLSRSAVWGSVRTRTSESCCRLIMAFWVGLSELVRAALYRSPARQGLPKAGTWPDIAMTEAGPTWGCDWASLPQSSLAACSKGTKPGSYATRAQQ